MALSVDERPSKPSHGEILKESIRADLVYMQKFRLYATQSNYYMIGRNKHRTHWKVLKIERLDPLELNLREDSTIYTEKECSDLLMRINEGNKATGGLNFVTSCYGIVGFFNFLGPYYMLIITKRRQIGEICGHNVYAVSKTQMIPLSHSTFCSFSVDSKIENRYKKLLCMVDLTKDFFFSYSYHVMRSLQKNVIGNDSGQILYETMFVWNEFLTREIRNHLQNTMWTVALVYGFFKQALLSLSGKDFKLTLIARRSRHYAGTRYLKRGVNEDGRVANDVEIEQVVFEDTPGEYPIEISSVVQNRGSIPLFWSQETSRLNIKPDIILSKEDLHYEATRLHFENLVKRYGNPIIILNLIKTLEKKPRESVLRSEFAHAIDFINKDLSEDNRLRFLHWDLHRHSRSNATNALMFLGRVAAEALSLTGIFFCQLSSLHSPVDFTITSEKSIACETNGSNDEKSANTFERSGDCNISNGSHHAKQAMIQSGVLRTNCIDCLDRTNVAQYAYGLAALGRQLHMLGLLDNPKLDLDSPLSNELMGFYERMGDTLAHQYGGSAAHNKIFSERRGQWKAATQSQEFFRTLQRYYSNAYMDVEKQTAINVFLGLLRPEKDNPGSWDFRYDQSLGRNGKFDDKDARSVFKRSFSDGNILHGDDIPMSLMNAVPNKLCNSALPGQLHGDDKDLLDLSPDVSSCETDSSFSRYNPSISRTRLFDLQKEKYTESDNASSSENGDVFCLSNFVDMDILSTGNSCEDESFERSSLLSSNVGFSSENYINGVTSECGSSMKELQNNADLESSNVPEDFPVNFVHWVNNGETICH